MIVYGHRGARGEAPENTIAGARHAAGRGVRHLEIDLRLSADGKLVVIHDDTIVRTAGANLGGVNRVDALSSRRLGELDARQDGPPWPNKRQTGVPTLTRLVKALPEIRHWQLELKSCGRKGNTALASEVVAWLGKHSVDAVVTSSSVALLKAVRKALPEQSLGLVATRADVDDVLLELGCDYLIAHYKTLGDRRRQRRLQNRGIHISSWTVNDASVIESLYRQGVDSVITDYPSMALPLVASLSRR
ncbi:MAG: glycerophosphodiester phosphodiesterase family protein [Halieaceae bacterium]|nr:glycerophosphodiester phosphodiesterase family protein [Halieaceae bacterium]